MARLLPALLLSAAISGCCAHPQWGGPLVYVVADGLSLAEHACFVVNTSKSRVDVRRDRHSTCPSFASALEQTRQAEEITGHSVSGSVVFVKAVGIRCGAVDRAKGCTVPDPSGRMHRATVLDGQMGTFRHELTHIGFFNGGRPETDHWKLDNRNWVLDGFGERR